MVTVNIMPEKSDDAPYPGLGASSETEVRAAVPVRKIIN
ncbi:hypothetical protein Cst_c19120 [Thermoclostridium stercorarium subsp. stercorarium DSM 8532]|uniref:Uncharacterized protein n=1 Tax=Thermoclostridium stercorarium (strain ATCC 35414 / DSM 8532 / NCIMB 11754) TaxID=1121335 RepID=L7VQB3_THES1|nr:hypothetical protein Cst_c19120 [Thermoclostridium stercorarium subsp. stercorarium DSM 8532]